jgi:dTDP-4-amino-4,6-dideoxygalactose transaminase
VFCDVSEDDYTLDPNHLEKILTITNDVIAVVVVSCFGHVPAMQRITDLCKEYNVYLIDDAAQSIGGICNGKPLSGWGDVGILSFGHSKIIDVGYGGAILTDDTSIYQYCKDLNETLPLIDERVLKLRSIYSKTYYTVEKLASENEELSALFWPFPQIFKELYIFRDTDLNRRIDDIIDNIDNLPAILGERKRYWDIYRDRLKKHRSIKLPRMCDGMSPWRFTFRIQKTKRTSLVEGLRARNIDVSTWYPSLQPRYPVSEPGNFINCGVANTLSYELVNLWIDPLNTNLSRVLYTCDIIDELLHPNYLINK